MFVDLNPDPDKIIYSHFTCATGMLIVNSSVIDREFESSSVKLVFAAFSLSRQHLEISTKTGLFGISIIYPSPIGKVETDFIVSIATSPIGDTSYNVCQDLKNSSYCFSR